MLIRFKALIHVAMAYAVVAYPDLEDESKIQEFRKKHDPYFQLIKPHITLMFPFPDTDRKRVEQHVSDVARGFPQFHLKLVGLKKSFDNWLFLLIGEGNDRIVELHDKLYAGMFRRYLREDIEFIPHVGLGLFEKDEDYQKAEEEAKRLNLNYECEVKNIHLIHLTDDFSEINWSRRFSLATIS
jgi:2'-5' RNA ligase